MDGSGHLGRTSDRGIAPGTATAVAPSPQPPATGRDPLAPSPSSSSVTVAPAWLGKRVGRFKLVGLLGQGGMGRVFRAEDTLLQRYAALKVLPKTIKHGTETIAVERLLREARAVATLEHPNVVTVYEVNEAQGVHYIAMELIEGGTLYDLVKSTGPLDHARACQLCADAADALEHAHQRGIIHRDVKPSNLMLTRSGRCKVMDFGLARAAGAGDLSGRLPEAVGTPKFLAPEASQGHPGSAQSDVYSLGATMWYLLTGKTPFNGASSAEVARKHLVEPLPDLLAIRPELPPGLVQAIRRALAKNPQDRFESAEQFGRVLRLHTIPVENSSASLPLLPVEPSTINESGTKKGWAALPAKQKRLIVGSGVTAIAAAILAAILIPTLAGRGKPQPSAAADKGANAAAVAEPRVASHKAAPPITTTTTINLFDRLDLTAASIKGLWHVENGDVVSDHSGPAILEFPQAVPTEYDFRIEFTPEDCVEQLLFKPNVAGGQTAGGTAFNWCMNVGEVSALESLNGLHAYDVSSPVTRKLRAKENERHVSVVRVRTDGVQTYLDGQLVVEWKTDYRDLSRVDEWSMRNDDKLGIGTWNKPTRFHKAELIVINSLATAAASSQAASR